jgi:hypothetical protein
MLFSFDIDEAAETMTEHGVRFDETHAGSKVIQAAKAYVEMTGNTQKTNVPINEFFERREDMGQGRIQLLREEDGDICLAVIDHKGRSASIQFCTGIMGGGRSPKTLDALYELCRAIIEENKTDPQPLSTHEQRRENADLAYQQYAFGDLEITDQEGWKMSEQNTLSRICYAQSSGEGDAQPESIRISFSVSFDPEKASIHEIVALDMISGNIVGEPHTPTN